MTDRNELAGDTGETQAWCLSPYGDIDWYLYSRLLVGQQGICKISFFKLDLSQRSLKIWELSGNQGGDNRGKSTLVEISDKALEKFNGILVLPMFSIIDGDKKIEATGLELVGFLRNQKKNYDFKVLFLVVDDLFVKDEKKDRYRLRYDSSSYYSRLVFGGIGKLAFLRDLNLSCRVVFTAELIFDLADDSQNGSKEDGYLGHPINIVNICEHDSIAEKIKNVVEGWRNLAKKLAEASADAKKKPEESSNGEEIIRNAREDFYLAFYEPYRLDVFKDVSNKVINDSGENTSDENAMLKYLNLFDRQFSAYLSKTGEVDSHHVAGQLFRPPVPFLLWRFFKIYLKVANFYFSRSSKGNSLKKMFLLDNREQSNSENKISKINTIFERYKLLQNTSTKNGFQVSQKDVTGEKVFVFDEGKFEYTFRQIPGETGDIEFYSEGDGQIGLKCSNEGTEIKIDFSQYLVVFLDFFLSQDKVYLAHDFIREYNRYKLENGISHNDWFFIVSAAHRDVFSYIDAGVLSSFSATTRVDFGDNPLLDNRRIIFLFKLLLLLHSRIRRLNHAWQAIVARCINWDGGAQGNSYCKECWKIEEDCPDMSEVSKCLKYTLEMIRQYILSSDDERNIFSEDEDFRDRHDVSLRLNNIILDFRFRPSADWSIIQLQIDYLEKHFKGKLRFACWYIKEELRKRSEEF